MTPSFGDRLTVAPTWEPVTLTQAKSQCRVRAGVTSDDDMFTGVWIPAAREYVETITRRAIPQQSWEMTIDQFPGCYADDSPPPGWRYGIIRLPRAPLISVDSVQYIDAGQSAPPFVYQTLATSQYQVDANTEPGRLAPAPFLVWPTTNPLAFQAIKIAFTAGYASAAAVPTRLKQAILFVLAHLYEQREATAEVALQKVPLSVVSFATSAAPWEYA